MLGDMDRRLVELGETFGRRLQRVEESQAIMENRQVEMNDEQDFRMRAFAQHFGGRIVEERKTSPENKTSQDVRKLDATSVHIAGVADRKSTRLELQSRQ